jgi:putative endonuclease
MINIRVRESFDARHRTFPYFYEKEASNEQKRKGRLGEELAAADLESKGYMILVKNFRCKAGEIDIVAKRGNVMVFVEVKTRTGKDYGSPAEAVGNVKRCQ